MEAKCVAGKFKPLEEMGLTSPHKTLAFFTNIVNVRDS